MSKLDAILSEGYYVHVNVPLINVAGGGSSGDKFDFVSYSEEQNKTEEEKEQARENIGITDDMYAFIERGESGEGGKCVIGEKNEGDGGITTTKEVGGINRGVFLDKNTLLEKILRDMLSPLATPTITEPSATLTTNIEEDARIVKVGDYIVAELNLDYKRGSVKLNNVSQGYRGGVATKYVFFENDTEINNHLNPTIEKSVSLNKEGVVTYTGEVYYDGSGVQPVDSEGNNYGSKLSEGSVSAPESISFEFVYPFYANTDINHLDTLYEQPLVSYGKKKCEISFPLNDINNRYTFDIPSSLNVVSIHYFNSFGNKWEEDCKDFWRKVTNIDRDGVNYTRYIYLDGTRIERNTFKIVW